MTLYENVLWLRNYVSRLKADAETNLEGLGPLDPTELPRKAQIYKAMIEVCEDMIEKLDKALGEC